MDVGIYPHHIPVVWIPENNTYNFTLKGKLQTNTGTQLSCCTFNDLPVDYNTIIMTEGQDLVVGTLCITHSDMQLWSTSNTEQQLCLTLAIDTTCWLVLRA